MARYLAINVFSGENSFYGQSIQFCLVKLDAAFQTKLSQQLRIVNVAKMSAKDCGLSLDSMDFDNRDAMLVRYGEKLGKQEVACQEIHDALDSNLEWGGGFAVMEDMNEDVVDHLPSMWPDHSGMVIGTGGYYMNFEFMDNGIEFEAPLYSPDKIFDMSELPQRSLKDVVQ